MSKPVFLACIESEDLTAERRAFLERNRGDFELVCTDEEDRDGILAVLDRVEIILGDFPRDLLAKAPRLKWYQQFGTGVDWLLRNPDAIDRPYVLTNCSDHHCAVLADHVFAMILAFSRTLPRFVQMKANGTWQPPASGRTAGLFELRGRTILVVGLGSIGHEIVKRAEAFGMRIFGVRSDPDKPCDGVERIVGPEDLDTILPDSDIVAVSIPHTPKTEKIFGARAFAAMKKTAFFFNVGRGGTVDEDALCEALHDGEIAGAGLDVFSQEPLPDTSPLWKAPNLLMTPHMGGTHDRIFDTFVEASFENLERYMAGEELRNIVDKRAGY